MAAAAPTHRGSLELATLRGHVAVEVGHIRVEPRALKLTDPISHREKWQVGLVVAKAQVVTGEVVQHVDHATPAV